tara:strand:+ start:7972 stop:8457 length:486 start_codon:yes stop_codon:yes gene_type:complete
LESEVDIGLAGQTDCVEIAGMSRALIENGLRWRWKPSRILSLIRHPDCVVITATVSDEIIGFAAMEFHELHAHLNLLAVKSKRRRNGVGQKLLDWLEESVMIAGLNYISLEVRISNVAAITFYEKAGYHIDHLASGYYNGIEDAYRMKHDLISDDVAKRRP